MTDMDDVVDALREGGLAIFPTETLWSLSGTAFEPDTARAIFRAKNRPEGVPLAVGFASWGMARQYVRTTPLAEALAKRYLPGPLSLVLERADDHLAHVAPGLTTLSVRIPADPLAIEVLEHAGPCVMTSANLHGQADPVTRAQVRALFPDLPIVGELVPGMGSTVVDARGETAIVLRQGQLKLPEDLIGQQP